MKKALALAIALLGASSAVQAATAAPVQRIDIVNLLAHSKATPGVTASPVTVKFYTNGSSAACSTATLPYDGAVTLFAGTGLACTTAITNISVTVLAGSGNVIVYNDYPSTALTATGKYSTQIEIIEATSGAPTFNSSVGSVTTKGTMSLTQQSSAE